jgi:Fic family protein
MERFLHDRSTPSLVRAALAHVQFETIHPFLDGNGRVGRLLITLIFCHEAILSQPLLYLSLFFKQHRQTYYDLLQQVRTDGDWEAWLLFFAEAMRETAKQAVLTARRLADIVREDRGRLGDLGRLSGSGYRLHELLVKSPVLNVQRASKESDIVQSSVSKVFKAMTEIGVLKEITGQKRNRLFCYDRYLKVLSEGTEPLP